MVSNTSAIDLIASFSSFGLNPPPALAVSLIVPPREEVNPLDTSKPLFLADAEKDPLSHIFELEGRLDDLVVQVYDHLNKNSCPTDLISGFIDRLSHHHLTLSTAFDVAISGPDISIDWLPRVNSGCKDGDENVVPLSGRSHSESHAIKSDTVGVPRLKKRSTGGVVHLKRLINDLQAGETSKKRTPFIEVKNVTSPVEPPTTPNPTEANATAQLGDSPTLFVTTGCPDCYAMICICEAKPSVPLTRNISSYARYGQATYSAHRNYRSKPINYAEAEWQNGYQFPPARCDSPPSSIAIMDSEPYSIDLLSAFELPNGANSIQRSNSDPTFDRDHQLVDAAASVL